MHEINFSNGTDKLGALLRDIRKAFARRQIEKTPSGLLIGSAKLETGGVFNTQVKRHEAVQRAIDEGDPEAETWWRNWVLKNGLDQTGQGYFLHDASFDHNLIPDAGINFILDLVWGSATKVSTWYVGLFTSDSTPAADWDGGWAYNNTKATELTNAQITGSARPAATFGSAASKTIATSSASSVTLETGVSGLSVYGATLNESSTIAYANSPTRILSAATRFGTAKSGLGAADAINVSYSVTGSST